MVRYPAGHKEESRARIVGAAGRGFRRQGYGGIGVDGLAREAGVTHGAFYGHFKSKTEAFGAAVTAGMEELRAGVAALRASHGSGWLPVFTAFYLGQKRTCDLAEACTLPTLSPDVERAHPAVREAYRAALVEVADEIAGGLRHASAGERDAAAWATLALLAGGSLLSRAVPDPALAERIAKAVHEAVARVADPEA